MKHKFCLSNTSKCNHVPGFRILHVGQESLLFSQMRLEPSACGWDCFHKAMCSCPNLKSRVGVFTISEKGNVSEHTIYKARTDQDSSNESTQWNLKIIPKLADSQLRRGLSPTSTLRASDVPWSEFKENVSVSKSQMRLLELINGKSEKPFT